MIVLMRHAHTEGGEGRCIGRTALSLSEKGRIRAEEAATVLAGAGFVRLVCSPAQRARDTASPLSANIGVPVEAVNALDEIDMGDWDGLSFAEIRARFPLEFERRGLEFAKFRPPGGENFTDVADRAMTALRRLAEGPKPLLAVTHAGVIRAVLCRATGHPLDDLFHFSPKHLESCVLRFSGPHTFVVGSDYSPGAVVEILGE